MDHPIPTALLTKEELRVRLNLPSVRMIEGLMRRKKIPYLVLGHRTVRFQPERVKEALSKLEVQEVGRTK